MKHTCNLVWALKHKLWKPFLAILIVLLASTAAFALEQNEYREIVGLDSRKVVWFLAQMHLFFGAFVLGVPLFAVIIEIVGWRSSDRKFDKLAYEFTSLLSVAYATTAAFGGLMAFALFTLYPTFMGYMAGLFKDVMFIYALLFFGETFCLYMYYYGWDWLKSAEPFGKRAQWIMKGIGAVILFTGVMFFFGAIGPVMRTDTKTFMTALYILPLGAGFFIVKDRKSLHILIGILLNIFGTAIMQMANSWIGFMMSPAGVNEKGDLVGTTWQVFENTLATPLAIHRMFGNLAFGGLVAGSYAAVKFIGSKTPEDRAHYDWMGYIANFVAVIGLLPLPFAGYYLGREVYSTSAVMGNNMMGGDFSWTFIMQAMLVGSLFLISNYYLWSGMTRIPGAERYYRYIKFILGAIVISFAIWLTPHNLPLTGAEVSQMGGSQYHPTLKFLGLMPAKNAVVNLIIISTFFSFLLYRRGNKGERVPVSRQGKLPRIFIPLAGLATIIIVGQYAVYLFSLDPAALDLPQDRAGYFRVVGYLLAFECVSAVVAVILALKDRGILAQGIYLGTTAFNVVLFLGVYGFVVMEKASPFLRNIAVSQFMQIISCLILVTTIDIFLFKGAKVIGELKWGKMTVRSQYALLLLTIIITINMGLMGFIRSGLRGDWHIFGVMRDTSPWSYTPSNFTMTQMVGLSVLVFLVGVAFMFWLGGIAASKGKPDSTEKAANAKADETPGLTEGAVTKKTE
ncbi:MAG: cytochrome ubiquinol oxidase subunit I [Deltaproteobacteria bacterium]|nr:cytochrome ubiquinol oxidase subunit I [Deltaproteobacteria bacterium]